VEIEISESTLPRTKAASNSERISFSSSATSEIEEPIPENLTPQSKNLLFTARKSIVMTIGPTTPEAVPNPDMLRTPTAPGACDRPRLARRVLAIARVPIR
jgi:hypothetical protein